MNGQIAQIVALTCHGNSFLGGGTSPEFFPANSTCQFCDRITFVEFAKRMFGKPKEIEIAKTPDEWFSYLKRRGAQSLRLIRQEQADPRISDRMSAGFVGGGGIWGMETLFPKGRSEFWQARWEVWNQKAADRRIWRVIYWRAGEAMTKPFANQDVEASGERLLAVLREIHSFAQKHDCTGFANCFAQSISSLTSGQRHGYHKDLAPPGLLSDRASMVLDAAQSAWVFGAMGSWNDMSFDGEDGKEYDRVSEQLFLAVTNAICAAANADSQPR